MSEVADAEMEASCKRIDLEVSGRQPAAKLRDTPDHTWSGDAANLSIDPRPGGCFCEQLPDGGVRHMQIVFVKPPELLRLEGGLGPLQEQSLTGMMTWKLAPAGEGCALEVIYRVAGATDSGLTTWAPLVDSVLGLQVGRLRRFIETGSPEAPPAK